MSGITLAHLLLKPHRFKVWCDKESDGHLTESGQILLRDEAPAGEIEHALAPLGIYAPRGADTVKWTNPALGLVVVEVRDGGDRVIVRLESMGKRR